MGKWYGKYRQDAYAVGPIEAADEADAVIGFIDLFDEPPDEVWRADPN